MTRGLLPEFEWDEHNERHVRRHGVTPKEFEEAMSNDPDYVGIEEENGEERSYALGPTDGWRMLFLVFTYRGARIRPITAWDAPKSLEEQYFKSRRL
jgi:uncharacterized protein